MDFLGLNWSCILLRSGQFAIMWQASWTYNISSFILRSFSHTFSSTCKKSFELEEEKGYFLIITHPFIFVNGSFEAKVLFFFFTSLEFIISCILSDLTSCSSFIIVRSLASKMAITFDYKLLKSERRIFLTNSVFSMSCQELWSYHKVS